GRPAVPSARRLLPPAQRLPLGPRPPLTRSRLPYGPPAEHGVDVVIPSITTSTPCSRPRSPVFGAAVPGGSAAGARVVLLGDRRRPPLGVGGHHRDLTGLDRRHARRERLVGVRARLDAVDGLRAERRVEPDRERHLV